MPIGLDTPRSENYQKMSRLLPDYFEASGNGFSQELREDLRLKIQGCTLSGTEIISLMNEFASLTPAYREMQKKAEGWVEGKDRKSIEKAVQLFSERSLGETSSSTA